MRKMLEADGVGSKLTRVRNAGSARVATAKCTVLTKFTGEPRCFTAGTLVQTENGAKPIEEIQVGDIVLATDPITLETSYQEVTLLHISETEELIYVTIEIEDGEETKEEVIEATPSHPFYVKGADFIRADSLKEGDELKSETGLRVTVKKLEYEKLDEPVKVYNLTISDDHTYYVGSVGVLVHNDGACGVGGGSKDFKLAQSGEDLYVGTYYQSRKGNLASGLNDTHTPHHAVQNAISTTSHSKGITINIRKDLHELTGTYRKTRNINPNNLRSNLAADVGELRVILRNAGYDRTTVNIQLQELIRQNIATGGFEK